MGEWEDIDGERVFVGLKVGGKGREIERGCDIERGGEEREGNESGGRGRK